MDQIGNATEVLIRRAERIASLSAEIDNADWVAVLISKSRQSNASAAAADLVRIELTLAEAERSAQKFLDLRVNLVDEVGSLE